MHEPIREQIAHKMRAEAHFQHGVVGGSIAPAQFAQQEQREPEIGRELSRLSQALDELESCAQHLHDRLGSVLHTRPTGAGCNEASQQCTSPLGEAICINVARARVLSAQLRELLSALAI